MTNRMMVLLGLLVMIALAVAVAVRMSGVSPEKAALPAGEAVAIGSNGIHWGTDLGQATAQAGAAKKHLLVNFYADWCHYCKKLEADTFPNREVAALVNEEFIPVRINVDRDRAAAERYGVQGLPTTLVVDSKGKEVGRIVGYLGPEEFREELSRILSAHG